jgi:histidine triad (HIT) family protein
MDCIFCKIVSGEIPSDKLYEDEELIAFRDINPQAPVHILIIPKLHIASTNELTTEHQKFMARLILVAKKLADRENIANSGYRLVLNCGQDGGQAVAHLHLHLLGGRRLSDQLG